MLAIIGAVVGLTFPTEAAAKRLSDRPRHPGDAQRMQDRLRDDENYAEEIYLNTQLPDVDIEETYLSFGPLQNRFWTNTIIIHHIGNTNADVDAATVHNWHKGQGWSGIGYHFLIRKDGTIQRGRPMNTVGAHAYGANSRSVGINIVGNFEIDLPTRAQVDAAVELIAALCKVYRIRPSERTIIGHRDVNKTLCPGRDLYMMLPAIRRKVKEKVGTIDMPDEEDTYEKGDDHSGDISQHEERQVSRRSASRKTLKGRKKDI